MNEIMLEETRDTITVPATLMIRMLGMISHKKSLITIFGHKHKIKKFHQKSDIFHKKFRPPSILVYIWNKIANFERK